MSGKPPTEVWSHSGCLGNTSLRGLATSGSLPGPAQAESALEPDHEVAQDNMTLRMGDAYPSLPSSPEGMSRKEKDARISSAFPRRTVDRWSRKMRETLVLHRWKSCEGRRRRTAPPCRKPTARCPRSERHSPGAARKRGPESGFSRTYPLATGWLAT